MTEQREITLDELLDEPIIKSVMARDGVQGSDIRRLMERVRLRREEQQLLSAATQANQLRAARGSRHLF
jgi:hypothetical protein